MPRTSSQRNPLVTGDGNVLEDDVPLLELRVNNSDGDVANQLRASPDSGAAPYPVVHRPPEPTVKLDQVRGEQLKAMMVQGKEDAEAARVQAGFLGGAAPIMIFVWGAASLALAVVRLVVGAVICRV